jgi:hypothetical protein
MLQHLACKSVHERLSYGSHKSDHNTAAQGQQIWAADPHRSVLCACQALGRCHGSGRAGQGIRSTR